MILRMISKFKHLSWWCR